MTTPKDMAERLIAESVEQQRRALLNDLAMIGEMVINFARSSDRERYTDQTGNLTSSLRYCICVDGQIVNMPELGVVLQGYKGRTEGRKYLEELATKAGRGMSLIFVAGMPYAEYVERIAGKNVLNDPEKYAKQLYMRMMQRYKSKKK